MAAPLSNVASVGGLIVDPGIGYYKRHQGSHLADDPAARLRAWPEDSRQRRGARVIKTELSRAVWEARESVLSTKLPLRGSGPSKTSRRL